MQPLNKATPLRYPAMATKPWWAVLAIFIAWERPGVTAAATVSGPSRETTSLQQQRQENVASRLDLQHRGAIGRHLDHHRLRFARPAWLGACADGMAEGLMVSGCGETPAKQTMQKTAAAQALPPGGLQMASRRLEPGWEALQALTDPIPTADAVRSCPAARGRIDRPGDASFCE